MLSTAGEAYALASVATVAFGTMGSVMRLSRVRWPLFFAMNEVGLGLCGLAFAKDVTTVSWAPLCAGAAHCIGTMCFMSAISLMGLTVTYPAVVGLETTLGTWLLFAVNPRGENQPGLLCCAMLLMVAAVAADVAANFHLALDDDFLSDDDAARDLSTPLRVVLESPDALIFSLAKDGTKNQPVFLLDLSDDDDDDDDEKPSTTRDRAPLLPPTSDQGDDDDDDDDDENVPGGCLSCGRDPVVRPPQRYDGRPALLLEPPTTKAAVSILDTSTFFFFSDDTTSTTTTTTTRESKATRMGLCRAAIAGTFLACVPVFESIAVVPGSGVTLATYLPLFAAGSVGTAVVAVPVRALYLRRPGSRSLRRHFDAPPRLWLRAFLAGALAGAAYFAGTLATFTAGRTIGNTTAVTIQRCNPLVATLWGVAYWRETKHASHQAIAFVLATILCYLLALAFVTLSAVLR